MRELFSEYALICLDVIASVCGLMIFFGIFFSHDASISNIFNSFLEYML